MIDPQKSEENPAKQVFIHTINQKKHLYKAHRTLNEAQTLALKPDMTPEESFKLAQNINQAVRTIGDLAGRAYAQQKKYEEMFPDLHEEIKHYAQHQKAASQSQAQKL